MRPMIDIPARVRACRVCSCTDDDCRQCIEATGEPCFWVHHDLCSRCAADLMELEEAFVLVAQLEAEDGRWLGLTRHRDGWRATFSSTRGRAPLHPSAEGTTPAEAIRRAAAVARGEDPDAQAGADV